jgi:hypothetical protein
MDSRLARRMILTLMAGLAALVAEARAGQSAVDPAQVVPLHQIAPAQREAVAEVIREHSFHRQGKADTFPCHPRLYLSLLNEPVLTLALWHDLGPTPARLQELGPNRFHGTDGNGTTATWQFVLRSPRLHVLLCDLEYAGPRGNTHLNGRIVLIVRSEFYREAHRGGYWVKHTIEAFAKVDSRGWKAVAVTFRPLIEKLLEDQVQEAGWFVSMMGRLVETYPNWATQVTSRQETLRPETKASFRSLVAQVRRPDAQPGRPVLAENAQGPETRTR